jgi:hypothetical protein
MTPVSGWKLGMIWVFGVFAIPGVGTGLPREAYKITMPSTICIVVGPVYPDPQLVGDAMNADDVSVTSFGDRHRRDVRPDTTCVLLSQPVDLDGFSATTSTDVLTHEDFISPRVPKEVLHPVVCLWIKLHIRRPFPLLLFSGYATGYSLRHTLEPS